MIAQRSFSNYADYVHRQGGKARNASERLIRYLPRQTAQFTRTFRNAAAHLKPGPILCLGARTGAESLGANAAGFTGSLGIDLHPAGETVVRGDWHDLQFADHSFANAYSNSLDHCLHLDRLAAGLRRVLVPDGRFYVMATNRAGKSAEKWMQGASNEALYWDTSQDLADAICAFGFTQIHAWRKGKWGNHILAVTR